MESVGISVVIPVFNEELNVVPAYEKVTAALTKLKKSYEIIFVDDGSTDMTFSNLQKLHERDSKVTVIRLRKNYGKTLALSAAFKTAKGSMIVTLDGDLQNDPEDIPLLLKKLGEGFDVVSGWRYERKDAFIAKCLPSLISNWMARKITGIKLHDFGCPLKAYTRESLQAINLYGDVHRYLPAIIIPQGFRVSEIRVRHYPRKFGKSKYGIGRLMKGPLDLIYIWFRASYATRPLHFFGMIGTTSMVLAAVIGGLNVAYYLFIKHTLAGVGPILLLAVVLAIVGVQFLALGFIIDIIVSTQYSVQGREPYIIEKVLRKKEGKE